MIQPSRDHRVTRRHSFSSHWETTLSTSSKHSARARKAVLQRAPAKADHAAADNTLDVVLRECSQTTTKEQLGWEIATCSALLRGGQQLREAQLEASRTTQQAYQAAATQLKKASGIDELANIQTSLARADFENAMQLWVRLSALASQSALDVWNESASAAARLQNAAWSSTLQWFEHQASIVKRSEVLEAEVEHVTNTVAATPFVWPSQDATRQAMSLATSSWNDLLSWSGPFGQAIGSTANGSLRTS